MLDKLAEEFYCDREPVYNLMQCLRAAKLDSLLEKGSEIGGWGPVVDGLFKNVSRPFLKYPPEVLLQDGRINKVGLTVEWLL